MDSSTHPHRFRDLAEKVDFKPYTMVEYAPNPTQIIVFFHFPNSGLSLLEDYTDQEIRNDWFIFYYRGTKLGAVSNE